MISSMSDIKHAFYINLESRPDRKIHIEEQLKLIGIQANRFKAIKLLNGALGCSMSHLKCLEIAMENNWEHILIVEDDIKFLNPELFISQINKFFNLHSDWDVVLVAGNNLPPHKIIDDTCVKVTQCQTTTGYIVKKHYYKTLIDNIRKGITNLIKEPKHHYLYAIDKYWFRLQQKDNWYLITPLSVTQREDYSDIEKKPTNYTRVMIDLNKEWLVQPKQNTTMVYAQKPPILLSKINFSI
jgi:GR25 family glycosyltransferase involved in LPS biosynthesis